MFDVSQISTRYFDIRLVVEDDGGETHSVELKVEPPTVKMLKRLTGTLAAADEMTVMDELQGAVCDLLSKNKTGYKVPVCYVENLTFDQLYGILAAYIAWVAEEKKAKN